MAPLLLRGLVLALAGFVAANPVPAEEEADLAGFPWEVLHNPHPDPGADSTHCTTTIPFLPKISLGPVRTVYTETVTSTRNIECGGCKQYTVSHLVFGVPPVAIFKTTVTATEPTTTSVLKCGHTKAEAEPTPDPEERRY